MVWWKRGGKRGRQFANGTEKNGVWAQDEKGGEKRDEKKKTLVCLESKRLSYRAGAKVVLKKIINCHLHLRCKVRE